MRPSPSAHGCGEHSDAQRLLQCVEIAKRARVRLPLRINLEGQFKLLAEWLRVWDGGKTPGLGWEEIKSTTCRNCV